MRVVVTGASGNVGTSVLEALGVEPKVKEIVGIARREPEIEMPKVKWVGADILEVDLASFFEAPTPSSTSLGRSSRAATKR